MADAKITALANNNTMNDADLLVIVDDVAGTPTTEKRTVGQLGDHIVTASRVNSSVIRYVQIVVTEYATATATGDGQAYFHIPADLNGMNLVEVHAEVITAGTTGTTDIQIANVTQAADMLTTKITIDSAETGSDTAATAAVIDATNDDVATNDLIRIDVDAVSTTPAQGLIVTLGFQLP